MFECVVVFACEVFQFSRCRRIIDFLRLAAVVAYDHQMTMLMRMVSAELVSILTVEFDDDAEIDQKVKSTIEAHCRELRRALFVDFGKQLIRRIRFLKVSNGHDDIAADIGHPLAAFGGQVCYDLDAFIDTIESRMGMGVTGQAVFPSGESQISFSRCLDGQLAATTIS